MLSPMYIFAQLIIFFLMTMPVCHDFFIGTILQTCTLIANIAVLVIRINAQLTNLEKPHEFNVAFWINAGLVVLPCLILRYDNYKQ
jgi:hypothetical protein